MNMNDNTTDINKIVPFGRNSQFYFNRAMHEYEKGNLIKVCDLLRLAIDYNPGDVWNYYNLALTYEEMEDYKQAIDIWQNQVLRVDENFAEAYYHLAVCCAETDDIESVYHYMEKYLSLDPDGDWEEAASQVIKLLGDEQINEDLEEYSETSRIMQNLEKKLVVMLNTQSYNEAMDICEDTIEREGELIPLLNRTALVCFLAGEDQRGLDYLNQVLEADPNNVCANCNLVFYYYLLGDEVQTQKVIERVFEVEFNSLSEILQWTQTLGNIGKHRRVYDCLHDVYWDGEYSVKLFYQLGCAALNLGKIKEANDFWRQASLIDNLRTPAELYHQLLMQIDDKAELAQMCNYNLDWPLLDHALFKKDPAEPYSEHGKKMIYICIHYYMRHGTEDIVSNVFEYLPLLNPDQQDHIIQEFMLSEYDDLKIHVLQAYDPKVKSIQALKSNNNIYLLNDDFEVKVSTPFLVTLRMIKDHILTYKNDILVRIGQKLWYSYCNKSYPSARRINKSIVWAAAVECMVLEIFNYDCDYDSIANRYQIKRTSMERALEEITLIICSPVFSE